MALLINKKARFEYDITSHVMAGVVLTGPEVKSLRGQHGSLTGSYVKIIGGEAWLLNAQIAPYQYADNRDYEPTRTRKLLLTKRELEQLQVESQRKGVVLVPMTFELLGRNIKLKIGIGRGKKLFEKRASIKARDQKRELERMFK